MEAIQNSVDQLFPDTINRITSFSKSKNRILIYSMSDRHPGIYRVIDLSKKALVFELEKNSDIDKALLNQQYALGLKMRDGVQLQSYLTLPGPPSAGPYPMVALVHGGPWSRDTWGYDEEVQLLANRGYAVFQLNFRGSSGYGRSNSGRYSGDFEDMVKDVADGTQQLVKKGWIDGNRLAIMGASFGGYASVAAQMFEPGLFQCSISYAGVFDMEEQIENWQDSFWKHRQGTYAYDKWVEILGDPDEEQNYIRSISPRHNAHKINKPVLLAHGKADRVVDVEQTRDMASALKSAGNTPETLYLPAEQHGVASMKNRIKYYERVLEFLGENLN
ncbi:MAG: alpha/beta hydrolase family protein [Opitutales bacterium]